MDNEINYSNSVLERLWKNIDINRNNQFLIDWRGNSFTAFEFKQLILAASQDLRIYGISRSDRILIMAEPSIELIAYIFAVYTLGATIVLADPQMGSENFKSRVESADVRWVIEDPKISIINKYSFIKPILKFLDIWYPEKIQSILNIRMHDKKWLLKQRINTINSNVFLPNDSEMMVVFTSGTTARPRGVMHTFESIDKTISSIKQEVGIESNDSFYASQLYFLLIGLIIGKKVFLPNNKKFNPKEFIKYSNNYSLSAAFLLPYEGERILKHIQNNKIQFPNSYKTILFGSAPITRGFLARFESIKNNSSRIYCVYGSTEILLISKTTLEDKLMFDGDGDFLGRVVKEVAVNISDDSEFLISGQGLCNKYLNETRPLEYFESGDIGRITDKNELIMLGRKKDMIIKNGINIYPSIFESVISKIPGIIQASIVGVYDHSIEDEKIILFIVTNGTITKNKIYNLLGRGPYSIDSAAMPDELIIIKEMPLSGRSKKINKNVLREIAKEKLCIE